VVGMRYCRGAMNEPIAVTNLTPTTGAEHLAHWMAEHGVSQTALARSLEVTQGAVSRWLSGEQIPVERCLQIEEVTSHEILVEDLRPDVPWYVCRGYLQGRAVKSRAIYRQAMESPRAA
jgi:DNA-binding transcriptional regulator YdaS (Cro superfamily)